MVTSECHTTGMLRSSNIFHSLAFEINIFRSETDLLFKKEWDTLTESLIETMYNGCKGGGSLKKNRSGLALK